MIRGVSRRTLHWPVILTALLLMALVVAACGGAPAVPVAEPAAEEAAPAAETESGSPSNQAPQWQEMVEAGELPPLDERLPANPKVIEPLDSIGQYGGTMRHPLLGSWSSRLYSFMGNENLVNWTPNWDGLVPNVAESWEVKRGFIRVHLPPARGHQMVGRRTLHCRRHHVLVQRYRAQRGHHTGAARLAHRQR